MIRSLLLSTFLIANANAQEEIRVLVWDEQQPEQKQAYGDKFLGETIAANLATKNGIKVKSVALSSPDQGLSPAQLDETDVLIFWSNKKNAELTDEHSADIVKRVQAGKLSLIVLHSAHWSKPFVKLMQERAIADARKQLGAQVMLRLRNENASGTAPKIEEEVTPNLIQEEDAWVLVLPSCGFPTLRNDGTPSHVTMRNPTHPIAKGLPIKWNIPQTEIFNEPFHVPKPDSVIFTEDWDKGETFRSGCVWNIGKGVVFYFRPGHETYPIFRQNEPMQVLENTIRWMGPTQ